VIREASVVGFMPSNSAAPPGPKILPPVCFNAAAMLSRSCRFSSLRVSKAGVVAAVTQRRDFNRDNAQAIEKVLAEAAGIDLFLQVAIWSQR
jgi:hypothetical protein